MENKIEKIEEENNWSKEIEEIKEKLKKQRKLELIDWISEGRFCKGIFRDKDGKEFFFKGAAQEKWGDQDLRKRIDTEIKWAKLMEKYNDQAPFRMPEIIDSEEGKYALWERFEMPSLEEQRNIRSWIPCIIDTLLFLKKIKNDPCFSGFGEKEDFQERFETKIEKYSKEPLEKGYLNKQELEGLKKIIFRPEYWEQSLEHGDFTPDHLFGLEEFDKIGLVDTELASRYEFAWNDAAQFYNRAFTRYKIPEIAKEFLGGLNNKISPDEREKFQQQFLIFSAYRSICKIRDKAMGDSTSLKLHRDLLQRILKGFPAFLEK